MDLTALAALRGGRWLRETVTGHLQTYFLWVIAGTLALTLLLWQGAGWLLVLAAAAGLAAVGAAFVWQFVLVLRRRSEPLKRIDRD
jgi:putative flippase GtrA